MRIALLVLFALTLTATGVTLVAPTASAGYTCVAGSPAVVQSCNYWLACVDAKCMDYPCRYCMPM